MRNTNQPVRRSGGGINLQTIIGLMAGLYGISPVDIIPDVIPVAGQLDDGAVIIVALILMLLVTLGDRQGGAQ